MILAIILNSARNQESEDSWLREKEREREAPAAGREIYFRPLRYLTSSPAVSVPGSSLAIFPPVPDKSHTRLAEERRSNVYQSRQSRFVWSFSVVSTSRARRSSPLADYESEMESCCNAYTPRTRLVPRYVYARRILRSSFMHFQHRPSVDAPCIISDTVPICGFHRVVRQTGNIRMIPLLFSFIRKIILPHSRRYLFIARD